jgi:hypothetical protein
MQKKRDRLRTSINVLGDAYGCAIVAHLSRNELKKLDDDAEQEFAAKLNATANITSKTDVKHTPKSMSSIYEDKNQVKSRQSSMSHNEETTTAAAAAAYSSQRSSSHIDNSPRIPLSITSMPQISVYQAPNFDHRDSAV